VYKNRKTALYWTMFESLWFEIKNGFSNNLDKIELNQV